MTQIRKYSVIVFDLGNVLILFNSNILIRKLDKIRPGLGKHFVDTYYANYDIHRNFERGKMSEPDFIAKMLEFLEHRIDGTTFCSYFSGVFEENKKVSTLLPELKKKYKLILLSNTNSIHERNGWQYYDFLKYFDELVLSHKVGAVKPDEKIYRVVEDKSCVPSSEHIFIDDIEEYVNVAINLGWDGIHFTGFESLQTELKIRKIL